MLLEQCYFVLFIFIGSSEGIQILIKITFPGYFPMSLALDSGLIFQFCVPPWRLYYCLLLPYFSLN